MTVSSAGRPGHPSRDASRRTGRRRRWLVLAICCVSLFTAGLDSTIVNVALSTRVTLLTDLDITGKPAQFGRGVMADVAGKVTDQFAACLAGQVGVPAGAAAGPASTTRPAAHESTAPDGERAAAVPQRVAGPQAAVSLDLFSVVALPVAKRFAPVLAGMVLGSPSAHCSAAGAGS
jgi:hypothetical protein